MNLDLLIMAVVVGAATWAFRYVPTRMNVSDLPPQGLLARFLQSTGPAAIATLFVASVLPVLRGAAGQVLPLAVGTLLVVGVFFWRRSVVAATLAGAAGYGLMVWAGT